MIHDGSENMNRKNSQASTMTASEASLSISNSSVRSEGPVDAVTLPSSTGPAAPSAWFDGIGMPVFAVDPEERILSWNRRMTLLTGYAEKQVLWTPLSSLFGEPTQDDSSWEKALQMAIQNHTSQTCRVRIRIASSTSDDASSTPQSPPPKHPVPDTHLSLVIRVVSDGAPNGEIVGAVCFVEETNTDMSSSSPMEPSMVAATTTTRHTKLDENPLGSCCSIRVDQICQPLLVVTPDGIILEWNEPFAKITGYSRKRVLGSNVLHALATDTCRRQLQDALDSSVVKGQETEVWVEFRNDDDSIRYLRLSTAVQKGLGDHGSKSVLLLVQDVTSRRQTERALLNLENMLDTANLSMVSVNVEGHIVMWNKKMAQVSGARRDQALGQNLLDRFIQPSCQPTFRQVLEDALSGTATANYELEFISQSGGIRYLLVNVTPRRDSSNIIVGALIMAEDVTEAAQHYRCVAAMARELRQLMDTANICIFGVDEAGLINEWNDKTAEITGYGGDEAFNTNFVESFIAVHQREAVQSIINATLKGRGTANYELELRTRSHETRFFLVAASTRRDAENTINGVVFMAQDITEASKHDRAVASMASELRLLIDNANAPIFGIDCDGDVNEWNDKTAEISGFTKEEAFDRSLVLEFIVPYMQHSVQSILDEALQGRGTSNFELEFRTKSNEIRHLLVNATTRRDAENNVVGVVGVAQDVTEAVQRDRAVAGMALELRQLIDSANAPIFGIDIDGNVNEWNRRTQEITGYSKEETFDEPLVDKFIAPSMRARVREILDDALRGHETSNYELEFVSKSGEPRFMLVNATTRRDPDFNVVGVVGVAQDVTEDRKHAAELRKMQYLQAAQEAKVETERNMTAYFAHELRNPLGAIDSALSALPDDLPEAAKSLVSGMQLCSSFMSSIMNNLLDVRKIEEGRMVLSSIPLSLRSLLTGVHKMLAPSVKPGVAFLYTCDTAGRDWVLGDEHRIQQVLTNVVTNAIKYTIKGSIELRIGWEGASVKFECIDTGPGIPKYEQEKLFQRFVQRGGAPGTGLGLAIAKHLVDLTGGSIRFDSDPKVRPGTNCIVMMPLPLCEQPDEVSREVDIVAKIEGRLTFLIIDDVKMNRAMLKRRIEKGIAPDCEITEACTGEEALEICGKRQFDVIIVDQYMEEAGGVMVGTDVVYAMRRMRIDSIIIGCSGNDLNAEFFEAGADWVWQKPLPSNTVIVEQLQQALAKRMR